jgi:hypothetical protein
MKNYKILISSGALLLILVFWVVFTAITAEKISGLYLYGSILSIRTLYTTNFIIAALISPVLVLSFYYFSREVNPANYNPVKKAGFILLMIYIFLASFSYISQLFIFNLPREIFNKWVFYKNSSIPYFANQLGYFIWSIGSILLFYDLFFKKGKPRTFGIIVYASALLSILAFTGLLAGSLILNALTLLSGILIIPAAILIFSCGLDHKKA